MSISSLVIISRALCIVYLIACKLLSLCIFLFFLFVDELHSSMDHDDKNTTIQKQRHSKSVSKNVHTERFLRCKVWQSGWDLLKMTVHSKKPDSKKLMALPPDDPSPTSPSIMSYFNSMFKLCIYIVTLHVSHCDSVNFCRKYCFTVPFGNKAEQDMTVIRWKTRISKLLFFLIWLSAEKDSHLSLPICTGEIHNSLTKPEVDLHSFDLYCIFLWAHQ